MLRLLIDSIWGFCQFVRLSVSLLLYLLPLAYLGLLVFWPVIENKLIKPFICERKLSHYFGTRDVSIETVRVRWQGWLGLYAPIVTLECIGTRVGPEEADFFRLGLLRVRAPGIAGFLSLPGIIRLSEIFGSSSLKKGVLVESFLQNLCIGCAVREMDTVEIEGAARAKRANEAAQRQKDGKRELHQFRRTLTRHHNHEEGAQYVLGDDDDDNEDDDDLEHEEEVDLFSVARKAGLASSMVELIGRMRAKRAAKKESSAFKACGNRFYDGPTLRIGRIMCSNFELIYDYNATGKEGSTVVKQRKLVLGSGKNSSSSKQKLGVADTSTNSDILHRDTENIGAEGSSDNNRYQDSVSSSPSTQLSGCAGWSYSGFLGSERELNNLLLYNTRQGLLTTMAMDAGKEAVLETVATLKEKAGKMAKRVEEKKTQLKSIIGERFGERFRGLRSGNASTDSSAPSPRSAPNSPTDQNTRAFFGFSMTE